MTITPLIMGICTPHQFLVIRQNTWGTAVAVLMTRSMSPKGSWKLSSREYKALEPLLVRTPKNRWVLDKKAVRALHGNDGRKKAIKYCLTHFRK